ncbi:MAG: FAD binding domain-containing protein [Longimicrobiales bacterium]|nr:FAD binding domain-containing protein [Longimicrobiales bacterium]
MGFDYVEPDSLEDAVRTLSAAGDGAFVIGGGTELMLRVRRREISPRRIVGLRRIQELERVHDLGNGVVSVGAGATLASIARSSIARGAAPMLAEVCGQTRSPQVRTLATLGGVVCGASPVAEPPLVLLAAGATVRLIGPDGERSLALGDFVVGPFRTVIRVGEILVSIEIPPSERGSAAAYERLARRESIEAPLVACACALALDPAGICQWGRVVLGVSTPRPIRLLEVESTLVGRRVTQDGLEAAARAAEVVEVRDDVRASRGYLRRMAPVVVGRALATAAAAVRANG